MKIPHKHADLIKAWADGAEIQFFDPQYKKWEDTYEPSWNTLFLYRIKPEPKPDQVRYVNLFGNRPGSYWVEPTTAGKMNPNYRGQIKITFDGETEKLKSVEIVK